MEKKCETCFYESRSELEHPCFTCNSYSLSNWVASDFLKDVEDAPGDKVMDNMLKELDRSKSREGVKYDSEKPKWTLLPFRSLQEVVEVLTFGAKKYAADNWKHVPQARSRYIDAAYRHLADWNTVSRLDPETNKSHLAHAICCLLFLLWFEQKDRAV